MVSEKEKAYKEFVGSRDEFTRLTQDYANLAARDRDAYLRKVLRFARLGQFFVAFTITSFVAISAFFFWQMFETHRGLPFYAALFFAYLAFVSLKACYLREPPEDESTSLSRVDAPQLWAEIDKIVQESGAPPVDAFLLDTGTNARARLIPARLLRKERYVMSFGVVLLSFLSWEETRFVIAHELGHFYGRHGRIHVLIDNLGIRSARVAESVSRYRVLFFYTWFFGWFLKRLHAMQSVLSRQHEFEADQFAVKSVGSEPILGLLRMPAMGDFGERFLDREIYRAAWRGDSLPLATVSRIPDLLRTYDPSVAVLLAKGSLMSKTMPWDTHPSLSERFSAVGVSVPQVEPAMVQPATPSAMELLFGDRLMDRLRALEHTYRADTDQFYRALAEEGVHDREAMAALLPEESGTSAHEWLNASTLSRSFEEQRQECERLLALFPEDAYLNYRVGHLRCQIGDASGIDHLERAKSADKELSETANEMIRLFRERFAGGVDADFERAEFEAQYASFARNTELSSLGLRSKFVASDEAARFRPLFSGPIRGVKRIDLVAYRDKAGDLHQVLVVIPSVVLFGPSTSDLYETVSGLVNKSKPPAVVLIAVQMRIRWWWHLRKVPPFRLL